MSVPDRLGDFRIVEEIGRGGFGVVYRAHQISLDRPVALKVLYEHRVHTAEELARFEREARAAARLDHRNIVSVYAWGEDGGSFYLAQKLVGSGLTLADRLDELREGGEPPKGYFREVAECLTLVADGLQHAHEHGIVHRDIKPSNILMDARMQPCLGDFGLAKVEDGLELSRTGDFTGSPFYMSPEQADSRRGGVDHRADIYGLGVTLYELLTLQAPFQGRSSHEIVRKILTEDPRRPSRLVGRVPSDLETICLKAMEKSAVRRYQSAAEFGHDLRCFLDGEPISAVPVGAVNRLWRRARRHQAAVGVVVLAAALVGLAVKQEFDNRRSEAAAERRAMERSVDEAKDRMIKEVTDTIEEAEDEALQAEDVDALRRLRETKRELVGLWERGSDLMLDVLPEIRDSDTVEAIGTSLQDQFLLDGVRAVEKYLRGQQPSSAQPDPRLDTVTEWLKEASRIATGSLPEIVGSIKTRPESAATDAGTSSGAPAPGPETSGEPASGPATSAPPASGPDG